MTTEDNRSRPEDRRHDIDTPKPPFVDNNGVTVITDRRITPDRRINNIEVEWAEDVDTGSRDDESEVSA